MGIIERCLIRVKEVYDQDPCNLEDYTKQDSIVLNLQRAIEATIDITMYLVSIKKLGIPQNSRDAFEVLKQHNIIEDEMLNKMKSMIGFRNIAVHNYQNLNLEVTKSNRKPFRGFCEVCKCNKQKNNQINLKDLI